MKMDFFSVPYSIKAHRITLNLTQEQFGKLIGKSYAWVSLFERGLIDDNGLLDSIEDTIEIQIKSVKDKKLYRLNWILNVYNICKGYNICIPRSVKNMIKQFSADISK